MNPGIAEKFALIPGINVKIKSGNSRKIGVYSGSNRKNESGNSHEIQVDSGNNSENEIIGLVAKIGMYVCLCGCLNVCLKISELARHYPGLEGLSIIPPPMPLCPQL